MEDETKRISDTALLELTRMLTAQVASQRAVIRDLRRELVRCTLSRGILGESAGRCDPCEENAGGGWRGTDMLTAAKLQCVNRREARENADN